jgi:hypothetical protein
MPLDMQQANSIQAGQTRPAAEAEIPPSIGDELPHGSHAIVAECRHLVMRPSPWHEQHAVPVQTSPPDLVAADEVKRKASVAQSLERHHAPEKRFIPENGRAGGGSTDG